MENTMASVPLFFLLLEFLYREASTSVWVEQGYSFHFTDSKWEIKNWMTQKDREPG